MQKVYSVVSVIIPYDMHEGRKKYVMVQERDSDLWNQPGGGIEFADGNPISAAVREVAEKSGLSVRIDGFVGSYFFISKHGNPILCSSFTGHCLGGRLKTRAADISNVRAWTLDEIDKLRAEKKLRFPEFNFRSIEDYLRRGAYPINETFTSL